MFNKFRETPFFTIVKWSIMKYKIKVMLEVYQFKVMLL